MEISDQDYQEYLLLKKKYGQDAILESIRDTPLEDDIDVPIKNCLMAFALLGCEPSWSCCGFDYFGQPIHKFHQYGRCYFVLRHVMRSLAVLHQAYVDQVPYLGQWQFYIRNTGLDWHLDFKNVIPQWDDTQSIHYSEQAVVYTEYLERFLLGQSINFSDTATIEDTNASYHEIYSNWQYPTKESWTFTKEDLMARARG